MNEIAKFIVVSEMSWPTHTEITLKSGTTHRFLTKSEQYIFSLMAVAAILNLCTTNSSKKNCC